MYASEEILRFLDGSLTGEEEAELLHRLSVSPERRDLLRGYMKQQEMTTRDRDAIAVPYAAEQKLWAKLNAMMPAAEQAATAVAVTQVATKPRAIGWLAMSAVGVMSLLVGFGSGFFTGKQTTVPVQVVTSAPILQAPLAFNNSNVNIETITPTAVTSQSATNTSRTSARNTIHSDAPVATINNAQNVSDRTVLQSNAVSVDENNTASLPEVSNVNTVRETDNIAHAIVIEPSGSMQKNPFEREEFRDNSLLKRWEFAITENFGKQYPDDEATTVSYPVVTNSSLTVSYQPFSSVNLWVGASVGSLNISKKHLTAVPTQNDPGTYDVVTSLSHVQSEWYGGSLQYRFPMFGSFNLTTSLGMGGSSLGLLSSAELGTRFDITQQVGVSLGMRYSNLSYNLDAEMNDIVTSGVRLSGVGLNNDSKGTQNSQNLDAVLGIYFHF
jgi:hypothetical protein